MCSEAIHSVLLRSCSSPKTLLIIQIKIRCLLSKTLIDQGIRNPSPHFISRDSAQMCEWVGMVWGTRTLELMEVTNAELMKNGTDNEKGNIQVQCTTSESHF